MSYWRNGQDLITMPVAKERKKESCIDIHGHTLLLLPFIGPVAFKNVLVQLDMRMAGKNKVPEQFLTITLFTGTMSMVACHGLDWAKPGSAA